MMDSDDGKFDRNINGRKSSTHTSHLTEYSADYLAIDKGQYVQSVRTQLMCNSQTVSYCNNDKSTVDENINSMNCSLNTQQTSENNSEYSNNNKSSADKIDKVNTFVTTGEGSIRSNELTYASTVTLSKPCRCQRVSFNREPKKHSVFTEKSSTKSYKTRVVTPISTHVAEKTTCVRQALGRNDLYMQSVAERYNKLRGLVKKIVEAREREKQKEAWNNYINELKNKHRYDEFRSMTSRAIDDYEGRFTSSSQVNRAYDIRNYAHSSRQSTPTTYDPFSTRYSGGRRNFFNNFDSINYPISSQIRTPMPGRRKRMNTANSFRRDSHNFERDCHNFGRDSPIIVPKVSKGRKAPGARDNGTQMDEQSTEMQIKSKTSDKYELKIQTANKFASTITQNTKLTNDKNIGDPTKIKKIPPIRSTTVKSNKTTQEGNSFNKKEMATQDSKSGGVNKKTSQRTEHGTSAASLNAVSSNYSPKEYEVVKTMLEDMMGGKSEQIEVQRRQSQQEQPQRDQSLENQSQCGVSQQNQGQYAPSQQSLLQRGSSQTGQPQQNQPQSNESQRRQSQTQYAQSQLNEPQLGQSQSSESQRRQSQTNQSQQSQPQPTGLTHHLKSDENYLKSNETSSIENKLQCLLNYINTLLDEMNIKQEPQPDKLKKTCNQFTCCAKRNLAAARDDIRPKMKMIAESLAEAKRDESCYTECAKQMKKFCIDTSTSSQKSANTIYKEASAGNMENVDVNTSIGSIKPILDVKEVTTTPINLVDESRVIGRDLLQEIQKLNEEAKIEEIQGLNEEIQIEEIQEQNKENEIEKNQEVDTDTDTNIENKELETGSKIEEDKNIVEEVSRDKLPPENNISKADESSKAIDNVIEYNEHEHLHKMMAGSNTELLLSKSTLNALKNTPKMICECQDPKTKNKPKIICECHDPKPEESKVEKLYRVNVTDSYFNKVDKACSQINQILTDEMNKSFKAKKEIDEMISKELYSPCGVQINIDIPCRDISTEVTSSLSKTSLKMSQKRDLEEVKGNCQDKCRHMAMTSVNTDPLSLFGILRVTSDALRALLSFVPFLPQLPIPKLLHAPRAHHDDQYVCNICGATFNKLTQLSQHIERHSKEAARDCCVCRHFLRMRDDQVGHFKCKYCGKCFLRAYCCELHMHSCARKLGLRHDVQESLTTLT